MLAPLWKMPLARPRLSRGMTRRTHATAHGQLNASPMPSITRQAISAPTAPAGTIPVSTPAPLHTTMAPRYSQRRLNRSMRSPATTWNSANEMPNANCTSA